MPSIHHQPPPILLDSARALPAAYAVRGMHGLGDNLHQRGIIRQLMREAPVWLETSWPWVYHDLVGPRLHLVRKAGPAQIYQRNQAREAEGFSSVRAPLRAHERRVCWTPPDARGKGSVLSGMCHRSGVDISVGADFRLPLRPEWQSEADLFLHRWRPSKRVMIYRPLVERAWWPGCVARNPEHGAYAALYRSIREKFFVISVAELVPGEEWLVGEPADVDIACHAGEIPVEVLAALVARASLVFSSPGFAVILAQAVGTPVAAVFGGYEDGRSFSTGARWAPYLPLQPITPCSCFAHDHACDKRMDVPAALEALSEFVETSKAV